MITLPSSLEETEHMHHELYEQLHPLLFTMGGNWDYHHGSFDKPLDDKHMVWLRIPFETIAGKIDGEKQNQTTMIKVGTPYLLKHIYNEGLDPEAKAYIYGALIDQFQTPIDVDAEIEQHWLDKGKSSLQEVERVVLVNKE
ncbi:YugN family protein [Longirhabdus pacifica]|uniref:YugN family protein n=1 Tax=Longirhabdus pacifica TaxID=2305227 RepID=UPI001008CAEF|nr:YugN family protein [Longirhabdus pacifica]